MLSEMLDEMLDEIFSEMLNEFVLIFEVTLQYFFWANKKLAWHEQIFLTLKPIFSPLNQFYKTE